MSERLPYEEQLPQQWADLPLPDENAAWADMKRRLEEDDDVVAWWRRGCAVWGLALLLLLAIGWWWLKPQQCFSHATTKEQTAITSTTTTPVIKENSNDSSGYTGTADSINSGRSGKIKKPAGDEVVITEKKPSQAPVDTVIQRVVITKAVAKENNSPRGRNSKITTRTPVVNTYEVTGGQRKNKKQDPTGNNGDQSISVSSAWEKLDKGPDSIAKKTGTTKNIPDSAIATAKKDSVKKTAEVKNKVPEQNDRKEDSVKKKKDKKYFFSAGIAEQQQVPIAGQKLVPYNSLGRKGTLGDYIPSVYFRFNKEKEWFVQTEFRYGAPQYTKDLLYGNKTQLDTVGNIFFNVTTLQKVKKTYYNQLSATFNYYVLPDWTVGGGLILNKFTSAISDQQVTRVPRQPFGDTTSTQQIVLDKNSSVFSKTYLQALFETQYQWKRFSIGGRYAFGLQPYIKFTLAGGQEKQEKNSSLQLFLRYELWRSKSR